MTDRWFGIIEFEINPFSVASRAARARRRGDLTTALQLYHRAGRLDLVDWCLERSQPSNLPAAPVIADAAREVAALRAVIARLRAQDVPDNLITDAGEYADTVASTLWRTAHRFFLVSREIAEVPHARERASAHIAAVQELSNHLRAIRGALATMSLGGVDRGEFDRILKELRNLAERARDTDERIDKELR